MFNDEEERKKREEEAKSIINSVTIGDAINTVNYANATNTKINVRNEQEQSLIDRINEANSIINSINPRENIPAPQEPSEEDRIKSIQNAQNLIDLMDRNTEETSMVGNDLSEKSTNQRNTQITKEELDKQIAATKTQNVTANNNQKNTSIINKNTNISIVSNPVDNTKEITPTYQKALTEAKQKNEDIQEGGLEKFEAMLDTFFDNVVGGAKQTVSGLVNLVTTGAGLGIRGLEGAAKIFGLEEAGNALNSTYNKIIDTGSNINETANYERTVNSLIEDNATKTLGDVTNVISNMGTSTLIGLALPVGVSGTAVQGLSVAGNSAQEVLDENKDNIGRATITGLAKGYTSYLTERMFDANILTKGMKKTSVQKAVDRLISNKLNSDLGKEIANRTVGILGENAEELVEDNVDNLIDKMINDKEMPGFKEWWENTTETAKITTISTLIMSLLGMGGESFHNKEVDIEADYWIDQAQQFIEQEDMAIHYNLGERKGLYDTKEFYITRFTPQGEIANIVPTRGKEIVSTSNKLNVKPAIVMDNITDMYTVIDENTGVVLDSTPYSTTVEAENGYNEKVNKLSDLQVRDINQKINNASYMVNNKFSSIIQQAKTELNQSTKTNFENINNNENVENSIKKQQNNINTLINTIDKISNKRIYKKDDTTTLLDTVSNNVKNIDFVPEDKGVGTLYSYDNEGNITKEQRLNNKFYTGRSIKNIVNTAIQNADTTYLNTDNNTQTTNIPQSSSEPNTSNFYSNQGNNYTNNTGYAVQDIQKVTEPFDNQESYSRDDMVDIWNNQVSNNNYDAYYDSNGNIERYIAIEEEGKNIVVNQYDNNDNVVKSEVIPSENGRYKASDIQDTISKVASLYDENRPIKGQRDIEGNEVKSMKKKIVEGDSTTVVPTKKSATRFTVEPASTKNSIQQNSKTVKNTAINKSMQNNTQDQKKIQKELHKRIQNAILSKNSKGRTYLGDVSEKVANKIKQLLGFEISDRRHVLADNDIRHMIKQHGNPTLEKQKGQIAITTKDIEKIPDIINNYDRLVQGNNNTEGKTIRYIKKYSDNISYVVEVVPAKGNVLKIKTMWKKPVRVTNSKNTPSLTSKTEPGLGTSTSNNSISQNNQNVKDNGIRAMKNTSAKVTDSQGRTLTKQQQEYFKDSKVRDENGNLLVMYHGTEANVGLADDYWFTIFDIDRAGSHGSMLGDGFYFTSDRSHAEQYAHTKGHIYETYLNIKNPLELNNFSTGELTYAIRNINPYIEADIYKRDGTVDGYKVRRYLLDNGYDGIHSGNTYVAFNSNQIKNITNSSPTDNQDIRYMKKSNSRNRTNITNNSKNLIAQHNTSEEKLMEALDLGALPVPSIAITKSDMPISNYGNITLLFNKDTINPTDRRNIAYNSDIYSTRRPQTVNSLDKNKVKTFENSMNNKGISYGYISQIEEYIQDNDFTRAKDTIRYELQKANPDVTEQEIENSFAKAMETIKDKRILREDVDPYTPSGNRRTIEQMSVPYTLDNIVRLMTKKSNKGSESNNFAGLPEVRANLSQQFKNIEEMHQQENNLVSTEEMQKAKEQLNDEFYNLIDEIGKYDKVERYFGSTDTVANALNETAKAKNISKEVLENELDFVSITNVPDKTLQKAIDFLNSLKNVPTEYFEVKPQRAVGLNEIQSAIVPKNTSKELIDKLKENNIPITYYDTQQERNKIIANETENKNIRFAKKTAKTPKVEGEILEPGQTNAQRESNYIEQEIRKIEESGNWDDSIPVTRMTDIRKTIENYLGLGVQKGHFRQQAYGIYKGNRDVIRTKELKDIDTILHETGHALDIGKRINLNKEAISDELLKAASNYGGYEAETREVQLEEGFAEVIREYTIVPNQARIDYPQTVAILEGIRQTDKEFNKFITDVQQQTYNYIHQNPRNRTLSNVSIGERTDQTKLTPAKIQQEVMRNIYDKDWALKSAVNEMQKINGKSTRDLKASENAYYLTRLSSGIGDKVISMLSKGYIDENGTKLMPGLEQLGEILGNNEQRFNDLRAYLVAQRDLEYKAKTLKTGIRTMDSKAVVEQFKNDTQIQEASKLVYDTLDGVMQYAVNNGLIDQETADSLRESNAFYVPMQRVLESNKNNVGRRGAVADVIKSRTGSELDVKDVLENIVANSANIIQQVENNNILKALYKQGEQAGMTGKIYDVIDAPMVKIGTAKLSTWERELKNQGVDTSKLDLEKTIDLFAPNNKVDTNNLITSFINDNGKRVYLQFNDEILFNSLMNMDKKFMSAVLNINRKLNMPLRYGATMANIGFAIPNMISDTAQAAIFSEAGFIPVVDNVIGIMDILSVQNKSARNFFNKVVPGYADRINTLYALYEQTGATSATRMSQYRERTQSLMKDVYGTKNSEVLGIKEKYKPLKRLLDIMTYIPELSEQSTRFRVFEKNLEYYRRNGMAETDARIRAALQSRDATQDFGRTGNVTREINQLIPFSAARVGSAYTFAEKVRANPKRVASRMAVLMAISMAIKAIGYDDEEIEELNQRKKNDNFVLKIGDQIVTIKKPQGILRSILNLGEYIQDLFTGHIEEGKEGERLAELVQSAIMDNMPADSVTGLVPNMIAPVVENAINKDLYYNSDIVKSYDLELPDSEQYYDYNSQLAIWLGQIFNYSPAKIDNLISGYFAGLGTSITDIMDYAFSKLGITAEQPEMGAEDNAVGKRFFVNVNSNSQSVDEIYDLKTDLTKKKNGGTITEEEQQQLDTITEAISEISKLNKQIKEIKKDLTKSGEQKADEIKLLQQQKTDTARQALGKELLYSENQEKIESTKLYPSRDTLSQNNRTLTMTPEMKKEYEEVANEYYNKYARQGLYSDEKLEQIQEKAKDYAKNYMMKKYKSELIK